MASPVLEVVIPGKPRPQGSLQLSRDPRTDREFAKYSDETVNHRNYAIECIRKEWEAPPLAGPVAVSARFMFRRPKGHYGTGRNAEVLKPAAPRFVTSVPDTDKLLRLIGDALTIAGVVEDDKLIVLMRGEKVYAQEQGTMVKVFTL